MSRDIAPLNVVIAGGTGFIGKYLTQALQDQGHHVTIVSRKPSAIHKHVITWESIERNGLPEGTDAVINLAGTSVLCLPQWTATHREQVLSSRISTNKTLIQAMKGLQVKVFIAASAVGYYPINNIDTPAYDETSAPGNDFLAQVCKETESIADTAGEFVGRVVKMRTGLVMAKTGGALGRMWYPFKCGVGGIVGSGSQPFPWIHMQDMVGLYCHALMEDSVQGAINAVGPELINNQQFTKSLGKVLYRPTILPVPAFFLGMVLGEQSTLLLDGQKVLPAKALSSGYVFQFPTLEEALVNIRDSPTY